MYASMECVVKDISVVYSSGFCFHHPEEHVQIKICQLGEYCERYWRRICKLDFTFCHSEEHVPGFLSRDLS